MTPLNLIETERALAQAERREATRHAVQQALIWLALVGGLVAVLLQFRFDPAYLVANAHVVAAGLWNTMWISLVAVLCASGLALVGAVARLSAHPIPQGVVSFYVSVFRGTPLLIQIYLIYSALPQIGLQLRDLNVPDAVWRLFVLDATQAGVLALSLNYGAYMTEIFRAGIQSIPHGQWEAAAALGLSRWRTLWRIILPQAVRIIIPDIGNQFIAMQKDSALVSVIGVWEITYLANRAGRIDSRYLEMYLVGAALYWGLTIVSTWGQTWLENRLRHAYER